MFEHFRLSLGYVISQYEYLAPTKAELRRQLSDATMALAQAKNRTQARAARERIDVILEALKPTLSHRIARTKVGGIRSSSRVQCPPCIARTKYRR